MIRIPPGLPVNHKTGQKWTVWPWLTTCYSDKKIDKKSCKNTNASKNIDFKSIIPSELLSSAYLTRMNHFIYSIWETVKCLRSFWTKERTTFQKCANWVFENSRLPWDILKKYFQSSEMKFSAFFHLTESEKTNWPMDFNR